MLLYRASSLCTVKRLHIECRTSLTILVFTVNCFYTESLINITIRIYKVNGGFTECSTYLTILLYTVSRLYNECPMSHITLSNAYTESLWKGLQYLYIQWINGLLFLFWILVMPYVCIFIQKYFTKNTFHRRIQPP